MSQKNFELLLFSVNPEFVHKAVSAGIHGILVDWESRGKEDRQAGANTEINYHTAEDLLRVRKAISSTVICRLNGYSSFTRDEVEKAIESGADELLLPMVRTTRELEGLFSLVKERVKVGILIETLDALQIARELASFPLSRVYIGLNDLAIERKSSNIFLPLLDGTMEKLRSYFAIPFGFGGITLPELGAPIPCDLLIKEMVRLECSFSFLRRSFMRDIQGRNLALEIPRIQQHIQRCRERRLEAVEEDKNRLYGKIAAWK